MNECPEACHQEHLSGQCDLEPNTTQHGITALAIQSQFTPQKKHKGIMSKPIL